MDSGGNGSAPRRVRRRRPRTAYRVKMERGFQHEEDTDLIDGVYVDQEGEPIGVAILPDGYGPRPDQFLLVALGGTPAVHIEGTLDGDHRVSFYESHAALIYDVDEEPPRDVERNGDRWDTGSEIVFTFESEEDALLAQGEGAS